MFKHYLTLYDFHCHGNIDLWPVTWGCCGVLYLLNNLKTALHFAEYGVLVVEERSTANGCVSFYLLRSKLRLWHLSTSSLCRSGVNSGFGISAQVAFVWAMRSSCNSCKPA